MFRRFRKMRDSQSGSAIAELSISVPFLLMFMAGVVDLSGWLNTHITASRIAYEGVRYAAVMPAMIDQEETQPPELKTRLDRVLERYDLADVITWSLTKQSSPQKVTVKVEMSHSFIFVPKTVSVRASARSAYLYSA